MIAPRRRVFYLGRFRFPDGDAAASRVLHVGRALLSANFEVVFGGWEAGERPADRDSNGVAYYEGFRYVSQREFRETEHGVLQRTFRYFAAGSRTLEWLHRENLAPGDCVIAYQAPAAFLFRLQSFCDSRRARLVVDCTEWYDRRQVAGGLLSPAYVDEWVRMRVANKRVADVIAISTFLELYYRRRGCNVLRVPPLIDSERFALNWHDPQERSGRVLRLLYAGSPANKDDLKPVVRAVTELVRSAVAIELHIFGPSKAEVQRTLHDCGALDAGVFFHGRVAHTELLKVMSSFDFSVLFRRRARYSEAGFPTKVTESLAAGVPVISTPNGDIPTVVQGGVNGFIYESETELVKVLSAAASLSPKQLTELREAARSAAARHFDYRNYVAPLAEFLQGRRGGGKYVRG